MNLNSNEINFKINENYGVGLKFTDSDGNECISICNDSPRRAILKITSFVGFSIGAMHYYASITVYSLEHKVIKTNERKHTFGYGDKNKPKEMTGMRIDITRKLTEKDFNLEQDKYKKESRFADYEIGEYTNCFNTEKSAIRKARFEFKRIFGEGWILIKD